MSTLISILPTNIDYEIWQGDTWEPGTITATISGTPVNFTGYTAKIEVRNKLSNDIAVTLTESSGIALSSLGVITITMTKAQTATLLGDYRYDLEITDTLTKTRTYTYGNISVLADATNN